MILLEKPICLCTLGSRGDLQPFLALAVEMRAAGLPIVLATADDEEERVRSYGVAFAPLGVAMSEIMKLPAVRSMTQNPSPWSFFRQNPSRLKELRRHSLLVHQRLWELCRGSAGVVFHPGMQVLSLLCREWGLPSAMLSPFPLTQTGDYRSILFYRKSGGNRFVNLLSHLALQQGLWFMGRSAAAALWKDKNLPGAIPWRAPCSTYLRLGHPVIHLYSPQLFPAPQSWPDSHLVAGSYDLKPPSAWAPPSDLVDFLNSGTAPIYCGFGSMEANAGDRQWRIAGQRLLRYSKSPGGRIADDCFETGAVPHCWLFPQMRAIVHHGGAGTTSSALRAGKPSVVVPHMADQPGWGARVQEMGCGPEPLKLRELTSETLALALGKATRPETVQRAEQVGSLLRQERGVARALQFLVRSFAL